MGAERSLIAILVFLFFVNIIGAGLLATMSSINYGGYTVNNNNETLVSTEAGFTPLSTSLPLNFCQLSGSDNGFISALQSFVNMIPGVNCITGFSVFLFSFQAVETGFVFLTAIDSILGIVLIYIALKLWRGGG